MIEGNLAENLLLFWNNIPLSFSPSKWSNTLKQFVGNSRHFVGLALKGYVIKS